MRSSVSKCIAFVLAASSSLSTFAPLYAANQPASSAADEPPASAGSELQEVVVTATRRAESLSRVPISVTALTQENMDQRGVRDFQDVARFTPGVKIEQSGLNNISIRGISGAGGASTTGIYIDDTPIQVRGIGGTATDTLPKAFDIDRIEVLRGPQGTLFGAGSEGGTVRYITTQASATKESFYSRGEVSETQGGQLSYELGVAGGVPLIDGKLGTRLSLWYRKDGGWIDRVDPFTFQTVDSNANHAQNVVVRLNTLWLVNDAWTVTPSVFYQDRRLNDDNLYWPLLSNPSRNHYISANPEADNGGDRFYLPSLKIEGDLGFAHLIFNSSYFGRKQTVANFASTLYDLGFYQTLLGMGPDGFLPGFPLNLEDANGLHLPDSLHNYRSPQIQLDTQVNLTEEIRLQSSDPSARLSWTAGLFWTSNRQHDRYRIHDPDLGRLVQTLSGQSIEDVFGGATLTPEGDSWNLDIHSRDRQRAVFGEASYSITDRLKATVGGRYSHTEYAFSVYNSGAQLFGPPTLANPSQKENSFTPKLGISYQYDPDNLYYATYAKGFRPGGGNQPIPVAACQKDTDAFGIESVPDSYKSDTTQSYEIGAKNNFSDRIRLASSIYYIRWNQIQQSVYLPTCALLYVSNLGQAVSKGADIQADVLITEALTLQLASGYTDARYTKASRASPSSPGIVTAKGDTIEGPDGRSPSPFTASAGLEYQFTAVQHRMYVRGDYEYAAHAKWVGPSQDPNTLQYNPLTYTLPSTNFTSVRAGMRYSGWDFSAFVDNLTDEHPVRRYDFQVNPGNGNSVLQRNTTFRPRTFGVTFTYRK